MRTYEVLFILSPQNSEEENTSLVTEFKGVGERIGAKLINEEAWGKRRLAYPISKSTEGVYHLFVFQSDAALNELDRRMKNSDRILRHLIVRTDVETRRAIKLAKKYPKKERVRPAPPGSVAAPAARPVAEAPAEEAAPVETAPVETASVEAAPVETAPVETAVVEAPQATPEAAPEAPVMESEEGQQ